MKIVIALPHRFSLWQAPPWFTERLKSQFPQLFFVEVKDSVERAAGEITALNATVTDINRFVASVLNRAGLGTLLFDLLTPAEEHDRANVFDIPLLARRLSF